jgi:tetratricopeptide (TPR) repeat protein
MTAAARKDTVDPYGHGLALADEGRHAEAIVAFERALGIRPHDIRALFALGRTADAIGHSNAAESFFRRVLDKEPDRIEALVALANLLRKGARTQDVITLLKPALERNPARAELWLTLGSAMREGGDIGTAETFYREALRLKPGYAPALGNLADLLADRGDVDEALALYDRALAIDRQNPQARLNRAILFLLRGELEKGWRDYEYRLRIKARMIRADHGLPIWDGKQLSHRTLLVTAEQGLGDQIMFASLVPQLAATLASGGGKVILEAEPRLVPLFARSFPAVTIAPSSVKIRGGTTTASYEWLKQGKGAHAAIPLGSLPRLLRTHVSAFPKPHAYLVADAGETHRWTEWLKAHGCGPFVGLCWRSGNVAGLRAAQYAPLETWADFIRACPATPVALQYDVRREELKTLERLSGRAILVPPALDQKQEIDRTSAMISNLDAVVSAPTSVAWIAATLGVATFKILFNNSWTAFGENYEPFAPACRCMMPQQSGDWRDAFSATIEALSPLLRPGALRVR